MCCRPYAVWRSTGSLYRTAEHLERQALETRKAGTTLFGRIDLFKLPPDDNRIVALHAGHGPLISPVSESISTIPSLIR